MGLAPVICFATARRAAIARQLQRLGVPLERITATRTDAELDDLWTRERTLAGLHRLTGHSRAILELWDTAELVHLERQVLANLMDAGPSPSQLIYSIGGHRPGRRGDRRRQEHRAWRLPA